MTVICSLSIRVLPGPQGQEFDPARLQAEAAGADALELNLYTIPTNVDVSGAEIEQYDLTIVREVCRSVDIPVAVKLSPFFSSIAYMAKQFAEAGARGLVLFNRFYQPDIDLETLSVTPHLVLSTDWELRLPLRWTAILYGRVPADLAITSGGLSVAAGSGLAR